MFDGVLLLRAQAAVVWMIGEFGQLIDEGPYLLEHLIDSFEEESSVGVKLEVPSLFMRLRPSRALIYVLSFDPAAHCVSETVF